MELGIHIALFLQRHTVHGRVRRVGSRSTRRGFFITEFEGTRFTTLEQWIGGSNFLEKSIKPPASRVHRSRLKCQE